jgi:alpha-N-arabinofuranosidase
MDAFIEAVVATADHVKAEKNSSKTINVSFDEWNVWYVDRYHDVDQITDIEQWPYAPRLLEDLYTVADAVVVGNLLISLLKHADRVTSASLAQLVNVIAPIMTEPGGSAWKQTTFFPFALTSRLAQGDALRVELSSSTTPTAVHGDVPTVDAVATHDPETGATAVFLVNRSLTESSTVTIDTGHLGAVTIAEAHTLTDEDPYAQNTIAEPTRVAPVHNESAVVDGETLSVELPPVSWTAISLTRA